MALSAPSTVRVRVCFDYPPPAVPDCRMCWVLVDLNRCRVVADLASIIRDKLEFSRRTVLDLFMEDCYLPPGESAHVVRDNDTIRRVRVDVLPQANGCASSGDVDAVAPSSSKRRREQLAEEEEVVVKKRRKKKRRRLEEEAPPLQAEQEETTRRKKKKKEDKAGPERLVVPSEPVCPQKAPAVHKEDGKQLVPGAMATRRTVGKKRACSSSETSSSSEEEPPRKGVAQRGSAISKPTAKPTAPGSPDSSSEPSDTAVLQGAKAPQTTPRDPPAAAGDAEAKGPGVKAASSSSDGSSSEVELVIKRPDPAVLAGLPPWGFGRAGQQPRGVGRGGVTAAGRGVGRGNIWPPQKGGGGRGAGRGGHGVGRGGPLQNGPHFLGQNGPHFLGQNGQQKNHQDEILTNRTVVLQNPLGCAPPRDYSSLPLLAAPPAVGQKIAFKLLELSENYTPEVSDYKARTPSEPGKFDLVYQAPDGSEVVEYAVSRGSQLTEHWESLLEPRLLLENVT
ncbi:coilin [Arapaima gigas]